MFMVGELITKAYCSTIDNMVYQIPTTIPPGPGG